MILLYSEWRLQQESNLHFSLRRTTLYPFNYGGRTARIVPPVRDLPKRGVQRNAGMGDDGAPA